MSEWGMTMEEFYLCTNSEFIEKYDVRLAVDENGVPTGKIRAYKPVSSLDFAAELLRRKRTIIPMLLAGGEYKLVTLWLIAYGYLDDDGNRLEGYSIMHATFDEAEASRIVREDLDGVPPEKRDGAVIYKDGYDFIVPSSDARTADEFFVDMYRTEKWPYPTGVEFLTMQE